MSSPELRLTDEQVSHYHENGFVVVPDVFAPEECQRYIDHHMALRENKLDFPQWKPREAEEWGRTMNTHFYDPVALELLLHPRLETPLAQCYGREAEGVQTMYFYVGSTQRRHQDQYYLPGCMSAWVALMDVDEDNGTIWVQPGSHKGKLITRADLPEYDGTSKSMFGQHYNDAVDRLFEENGSDEVIVRAKAGSVVFFHGVLIHRGGPIGNPGAYRHVMANHYVPYAFDDWPYADWPRYRFTGEKRYHAQAADMLG